MSHVRETAKPGDLRGVRVLVVEDQWHVANALRSLLEVEGMQVSGPAGKTAARLDHPASLTRGGRGPARRGHHDGFSLSSELLLGFWLRRCGHDGR